MNNKQRKWTLVLLLMTSMYMLVVPTPAAPSDNPMAAVQMAQAQEIRCLANNIYHEARAEPVAGQYAVALVTLNRAERANASVCEVVKEHRIVNGRAVCQFSWYCNKHKRKSKLESESMMQSLHIADQVMEGNITKSLKPKMRYATHFHNDAVRPAWADQLKYLGKLGNHHFYDDKQRT